MNELLSQQLVKLSIDALAVLVPILVAILANNLRNYARNQNLIGMKQIIENKQLIAKDAVLFAQQVFKHSDGETRYRAALEVLTAKLQGYGIKVKEEELDELIHTALKSAKKEFAGVWEAIGPENSEETNDSGDHNNNPEIRNKNT